MKKLISVSPQTIDYIESIAISYGSKHKFSAAIEKIVEDHRKSTSIVQMQQEIKELQNA
jgi:hypothetical protein